MKILPVTFHRPSRWQLPQVYAQVAGHWLPVTEASQARDRQAVVDQELYLYDLRAKTVLPIEATVGTRLDQTV